jgi:CARDB
MVSCLFFSYPANDIKSTELIPIVENELAVDYVFQSLIGNDTIVKSIDWVVPDDRDYSFLLVVDPEDEVEEYDEDDNANEDTINNGVPSELIEWLLGRYTGDPTGFDANEDGLIDAADALEP